MTANLKSRFIYFIFMFIQEVFTYTVVTKSGKVQGTVTTTPKGERVKVFYGIPYAKPPIGELRFKHPEPVEPWRNIFNARNKPISCWQPIDTHFGKFKGTTMWNVNTKMSEDCLTLNIWVPESVSPEQSMAVLVWIHGGGFYSGTSTLDIYDGKILASEGKIIVVSMNYRLGAFGFLYLGTQDAPGNAGFFDQVMALQWVKSNIAEFGGDSDRITLFGSDAGAVSVNLHQLSPLSKNLFNSIILQSASGLAPWSNLSLTELQLNSYELVRKVSGAGKISRIDKVMSCLRNKRPEDFVNALNQFRIYDNLKVPFAPVVDGKFLKIENSFEKCSSVLAGSNFDEGTLFNLYHFPDIYRKVENATISEDDFMILLEKVRPKYTEKAHYRFLLWEYSVDSPHFDYFDLFNKIVGDKYFTCPVIEMMQFFSNCNLSNLYMYHFAHRSSNHVWPNWMGVIHGDEIPYIFGEPLLSRKGYNDEEKQLSRDMIRYWSNFAKTGNPNFPTEGNSIWPAYKYLKYRDGDYLVLDAKPKHIIKSNLRENHCRFWKLRLFFD